MSQAAKAQEPSMEEILASIRRIIADDETAKPPAKLPDMTSQPASFQPPKSVSVSAAPPPPPAMNQDAIDSLLAGFGPAEPVPPPAPDLPIDEPEVLELTEAMRVSEDPPEFQTMDASSDVVFAEPLAEPAPQPRMAPQPMRNTIPQPDEPPAHLLSSETTTAVNSAFGALAHTVLVQNARTLDDLVREMLRPMLKGWLDDNLPTIVERLVRQEIERVSRGRG